MIVTSLRADQIVPSPAITMSAKAKAMAREGRDILDLSIGEPDFDTPTHIIEAAADAMRQGQTRYAPAGGTAQMKEAVAQKFRRVNELEIAPEQITVANGAKQIIFNALMATLNPGDEVIIPAPYWMSYPDMVKLASGKPVVVSCAAVDGFKLSPEQLERAITGRTRWLILNSPSNPTGAVYSAAELAALEEVLKRHPHVLIMSDEIYEQIVFGAQGFVSFLSACPDLAGRTLVVNGVSKTYAMTGWRIGYGVAPEPLARAMTKVQSQSASGAGSVSQAAAVAALTGPQDFVTKARGIYEARRDLLSEALSGAQGFRVSRVDGAFYLFCALDAVEDDVCFASALLDQAGLASLPGSAFGAPGFLRLSFATDEATLQKAATALTAFVAHDRQGDTA